jgi:hypothetical protein
MFEVMADQRLRPEEEGEEKIEWQTKPIACAERATL